MLIKLMAMHACNIDIQTLMFISNLAIYIANYGKQK